MESKKKLSMSGNLTLLDDKFKVNPSLQNILWNTLLEYFRNDKDETLVDTVNKVFGDPVGQVIEELIKNHELSIETIREGSYQNKEYFISLVDTFASEWFRLFLFNRNPLSLYNIRIDNEYLREYIRFTRADKEYIDIAFELPAYNYLISTVLENYDKYIDEDIDTKKQIISDLGSFRKLIDEIIDKINVSECGGENE